MLYKFDKRDEDQTRLIPQPFRGLALEKDLENILAENLWQMLEGNQMMPIFQERCWQPEADIFALKENGDLVIFELKRDHGGEAYFEFFSLPYDVHANPAHRDVSQACLSQGKSSEFTSVSHAS